MLIAAAVCENNHQFKEMFSFFSAWEIEVCHALLQKICSILVDGSFGQVLGEILQEKGRFWKHLFLFSTLHIPVRTG